MPIAPYWTDAEDEIVRRHIGLRTSAAIAGIFAKAGYKRSAFAVSIHARHALGLTGYQADSAPNLMSMMDVIREVGCPRSAVDRYCKANGYKLNGRGKCRYVSMGVIEPLKKLYSKTDRTVSLTQAGQRLGYCETQMRRLVIGKRLPSTRRGNRWRIKIADLEKLASLMLRRKISRVMWMAEYARLPEVCITTKEAALVLDCKTHKIAYQVQRGYLRGYRVGRYHLVALADLRERFPNKVFSDPVRI